MFTKEFCEESIKELLALKFEMAAGLILSEIESDNLKEKHPEITDQVDEMIANFRESFEQKTLSIDNFIKFYEELLSRQ